MTKFCTKSSLTPGGFHFTRCLLLALLCAVGGLFAGCKTTEPENEAMTPWNKPKTWEQGAGLPGGMFDRR